MVGILSFDIEFIISSISGHIYFDKSNEYYFYYLKVVVRATNGAAKDNVVKEKETAMKIATAYQD